MLFKKLLRLWRRRKAISPILTSIIVIITTITISAIIYFVVIPLLTREDLIIIDYTLEDTNDSNFADTITIVIKNDGSTNYNISKILIDKDDMTANWTLGSSVYLIAQNDKTTITCSADTSADELAYSQNVKFKLVYENKVLNFYFKIPAEFSTFEIIAGEDFENFTYTNWTYNLLYIHNIYGNHNISDWIVDNRTGNDFWHCTNNDCQYVIKNDTSWLFSNSNISCDLSTNGNDAMDIIFRYNDTGLYPNFYIAWYTLDHPSARNGPHVDEVGIFDWDNPSDQIILGEITVHYVEGDADGFNWFRIASVRWERETNEWYTWRINADDNQFDLFIDNGDTPELSFFDSRIDAGYIGLISFANENTQYDNLYLW